jgi:uncharacterized protein (TIGR02231 family)
MRKSIVGLVGVCVCVTAFAQDAQNTEAKITAVTVFSDKAQVTRTAVAKLTNGTNTIRVPLKEYAVDGESLTAKVFAKGELYAVQYRTVFTEETPQADVRALEDALEKLRMTRKDHENRIGVLHAKEQVLVSGGASPVDKEKAMSAAERKEMLALIESELSLVYAGIKEQEMRLSELDKQIAKVENEIAQKRGVPGAQMQCAEIVFSSKEAQDAKIELSYVTMNASWSPIYKADAAVDGSGATLTLFAQIRQKTGENWDAVTCTLSNAVPLEGGVLPQAESHYLDVDRPVRAPRMMKAMPMMAMASMDASAPMGGRADLQEAVFESNAASYAQAVVRDTGVAFEFVMPQAFSLSSSDEETMLPVKTQQLPGVQFAYVYPRADTQVYQVYETPQTREFLAAPMNVYLGGSYVGKTFVGGGETDASLMLNLGVDRAVTTERKITKDKVQETIFGKIEAKRVVREVSYDLVVRNRKGSPQRVRLFDVVPVAKTDKIEVKNILFSREPNQKNVQAKDGVMRWDIEIPQGGEATVTVSYTLVYPAGENVYPF